MKSDGRIARTVKAGFLFGLICLGIVFGRYEYEPRPAAASELTVAIDRWLEVRSFTGTVLLETERGRSSARTGVRLRVAGDTLQTMNNSTAVLAVDTGAGFINLSENTILRVKRLKTIASGGRLTRLQVLSGQARLNIYPYTNPDSGLEVEKPAGWSGVRGTEFGVVVRPDGTTTVTTLEGRVEVGAQQQSVMVDGGFQSLIVVGEPPSPTVPMTENTQLDLRRMERIGRTVYLTGTIDPANLLLIEETAQSIEPSGNFEITLPAPDSSRITAVVITPLGKTQEYELGLY